jgi:MoxR-like ATPase
MSKYNYKFTIPNDDEQPLIGIQDRSNRKYYPYLPSEQLVKAVNLAIALKRPLLLEGEPGCGKTQLASALVYQLTKNNPETDEHGQIWWPFFTWNVKSSSRAKDGLYTFDAVARLRDAQMAGIGDYKAAQAAREKVEIASNYLNFGALGDAIKNGEGKDSKRAVLLIDEIDKADNDFGNDLLLELDQFRFDIPETDQTISAAGEPPIVILTSNRERPLPDAFLRRCLYFNIEFPKKDALEKIAEQRFADADKAERAIFYEAIKYFNEVRDFMDEPGHRPPSTSEFIDLLEALRLAPEAERAKILEGLAKPEYQRFLGLLLKTEESQQRYCKLVRA